MSDGLMFQERVSFDVPEGTALAIERAAMRLRVKPSEFARRMFLDGLERNGFTLTASQASSAGHGG